VPNRLSPATAPESPTAVPTSPDISPLLCYSSGPPRALPPVPTRRSSDLPPDPRSPPGTPPPARRRRTAPPATPSRRRPDRSGRRSEEHTSELQSRRDLVCRLLLEKKNRNSRHVKRLQL